MVAAKCTGTAQEGREFVTNAMRAVPPGTPFAARGGVMQAAWAAWRRGERSLATACALGRGTNRNPLAGNPARGGRRAPSRRTMPSHLLAAVKAAERDLEESADFILERCGEGGRPMRLIGQAESALSATYAALERGENLTVGNGLGRLRQLIQQAEQAAGQCIRYARNPETNWWPWLLGGGLVLWLLNRQTSTGG